MRLWCESHCSIWTDTVRLPVAFLESALKMPKMTDDCRIMQNLLWHRFETRVSQTYTGLLITKQHDFHCQLPSAYSEVVSGFGGLVVSLLASGTQDCGFAPG
jgi:hypothetical protein